MAYKIRLYIFIKKSRIKIQIMYFILFLSFRQIISFIKIFLSNSFFIKDFFLIFLIINFISFKSLNTPFISISNFSNFTINPNTFYNFIFIMINSISILFIIFPLTFIIFITMPFIYPISTFFPLTNSPS